MRGAARMGGKSFKVPPNKGGGKSFDPFDVIPVDDLPVAPQLTPVNDNWSWSIDADPADPRDCTRYPASPYCGEIPFRPGSPFGITPELRSNGCETCVYIYPVILWLMATPQVICYRDPNCDKEKENPPKPWRSRRPPELNEKVLPDANTSPYCAERISQAHAFCNYYNRYQVANEAQYLYTVERSNPNNLSEETESTELWQVRDYGNFYLSGVTRLSYEGAMYGQINWNGSELVFSRESDVSIGIPAGIGFNYITFKRGGTCGSPPPPPPILPPPPPPPTRDDDDDDDDDRKRKRRRKKVCCNDCADSRDNTDKLLREIKEIKKILGSGKLQKALNAAVGIGDDSITGILDKVSKRIGIDSYPIEVPEALLQGQGDKVVKLQSNAEFLYWIVTQFDGLVGQFPVDIEVKDIDPLKAGDQTKTITLPNIAEAIAEIYGLTIKSSVNQEVELNMLLRLAAEVIATKNAAVVTQDYARANANFLGYKANYKPRELEYNFDFSSVNLDPRSRKPLILEDLLKTVTGYVQGWQLEDKETVVGFLQKLMFSAGIIKAVFFRGKNNQKELNRELNSMADLEKSQDEKFEAFIKEINDPNSKFNKNSGDKPEIKDETPPDKKGTK